MLNSLQKKQKSKFRSVSKLETSDFKSIKLGSIVEVDKSFIEGDSHKLGGESIGNLPVLVGIHDFNNSTTGTAPKGVNTGKDLASRGQLPSSINPQADD